MKYHSKDSGDAISFLKSNASPKEKGECDFLIKENSRIIIAIQVAYELNEDNKKREIEGLLEAMRKFGLMEGFILTYNQEDEIDIEDKRIVIKPVWKWL